MEAILPDLNTAYIKYRIKAMDSLDSGKYLNAVGALNSMNGLLPREYQVLMDDYAYQASIKQITIVKCNNCTSEYNTPGHKDKVEKRPTEHDFKDIRIYEYTMPPDLSYITGVSNDKRWDCPKCHKHNRLSSTQFIKTTLQKPYFLKVVPNPPQRRDGIIDAQTYQREMRKYIWQYLYEIEYQMGEYRRNYQPKEQGQDLESEYTSLDEDDMT